MRKIHKGESFVLKIGSAIKTGQYINWVTEWPDISINKQIEHSFMNLAIPQTGNFLGGTPFFVLTYFNFIIPFCQYCTGRQSFNPRH